VQIAASLAESEEKTAFGLEALLRSCHLEARRHAAEGSTELAAAAGDAAEAVTTSLVSLRRSRGINRQLLLEATFLSVARRYGGGRGA
jgi:hypothetical protein